MTIETNHANTETQNMTMEIRCDYSNQIVIAATEHIRTARFHGQKIKTASRHRINQHQRTEHTKTMDREEDEIREKSLKEKEKNN